jgi:hypothetical protein
MLAPTPYQAQYAIPDLVTGNTPTGAELIEAIQSGQSVKLTLAQIVTALAYAPTIRLPAFNATIAILTSDIEVGVSTATGAVTVNLPSAAAWAAAFPGGATGLDLMIIDHTGNAAAHNMTFVLNGADTFLQGAIPALAVNFGSIRLRPNGSPVSGWVVKGFG